MSKNETWMTRHYWDIVGGLLIEEYVVVKSSASQGVRRLDGLIILDEPKDIIYAKPYDIIGKDVICIQTKNGRLGMSVMGQACFSRELLKLHNPKSIRTVVLVPKSDDILIKICEKFNIEVVVIQPQQKRI